MHTGFWLGNRGKHPGENGRIILKWIFNKLDRDFDWIDLVMGNFLTSWELLSFQEGLSPIKLLCWIPVINVVKD